MEEATTVTGLSGKGGVGKTLWQTMLAGEASRAGRRTLLVDIDPERNLSNRQGIKAHSTGIGSVLEDAGAMTGESDPATGAKRLDAEILPSSFEHVDFLPAGSSLAGLSQVAIADTWLLRDIFGAARLSERYELVLIDTGGRTGSLVSLAMYAGDVAYAPIAPTTDAVRKAIEARTRVERIQRAHPLRWAGVVVSGFDVRTTVHDAIRGEVYRTFGDQVRAEVPRRATINEAFELRERLGDRRDVTSTMMAEVFRRFLERDLMGLPGHPDGVLR